MKPMEVAAKRARRPVRERNGVSSTFHRIARNKKPEVATTTAASSHPGSADATSAAMAPRSSPRNTHQSSRTLTESPTADFHAVVTRAPQKPMGGSQPSALIIPGARRISAPMSATARSRPTSTAREMMLWPMLSSSISPTAATGTTFS